MIWRSFQDEDFPPAPSRSRVPPHPNENRPLSADRGRDKEER
jgi:hypothetical protein